MTNDNIRMIENNFKDDYEINIYQYSVWLS